MSAWRPLLHLSVVDFEASCQGQDHHHLCCQYSPHGLLMIPILGSAATSIALSTGLLDSLRCWAREGRRIGLHVTIQSFTQLPIWTGDLASRLPVPPHAFRSVPKPLNPPKSFVCKSPCNRTEALRSRIRDSESLLRGRSRRSWLTCQASRVLAAKSHGKLSSVCNACQSYCAKFQHVVSTGKKYTCQWEQRWMARR